MSDVTQMVRLGGRVFDAGSIDVSAQLRNLADLIDQGRVVGTITSLDYGHGGVKLILDVLPK